MTACTCPGSVVVGSVVMHMDPVSCHVCGMYGRVMAWSPDETHVCPACVRERRRAGV